MPRIANVLHHFRGAKRSFEYPSRSPLVNSAQYAAVLWVPRANYGKCRLQEIRDRRAFPHELGIDANSEVLAQLLPAGFFQCGHDDGLGGSRQNSAAQHNQMKPILLLQNLADLPAHRFDMAKVKLSISQTRRSHAEKGNVAVQDRIFRVRSSMQSVRGIARGTHSPPARLDRGTAARLHRFDLRRAKVNPNDLMALACEAGRRDRAH